MNMDFMLGIKLYTTEEAAKILGVTSRTLSSYISSGRLKANKIGGKQRITEENLKRFITGESAT
jgi:excisionase family DNA binding protein